MNILVLNQNDMEKVVNMQDIIQADKDALALYSRGDTDIPLRTYIAVPSEEAQSLFMPGYAAAVGALGIKIVSVYPNNIAKGKTSVPATMILMDANSGEVCALLDGTYLTQLRTGAVSGAATDLFARKDSRRFALFGAGGQAKTQLEAVLCVRPVQEVAIYDINQERGREFAQEMRAAFAARYGVRIEVAASAQAAVQDADIITVVTTAHQPVFSADDIKPGVHINGVGSFTPQMQELDPRLLTMAAKIYVDTRDGVLNESGDFIQPIAQGHFQAEQITGELGEAVDGVIPCRAHEEEITLFKSTGSAVLDIVAAKRIYEQAVAKQIGQYLTL